MSEQIDLTNYVDSDSETGSEWVEKRLGEIFESIYSGGTPKKGVDEYYDGNVPFVKIEDLNKQQGDGVTTAENYITEQALEETSTRAFDSGTLLMTIYGSLAETALVQSRVATNQGILGLWDAGDDNVLYVRYAIDNSQPKLASLSRQTTQANLGKGIVKKHKIPIPPLREQRKIATVLYTVDRAIEKTDAILSQYDRIKKALIFDFLSGGFTEEELVGRRLGPKPIQIPESWNIVELGNIADVKNGIRIPPGDDYSDEDTGYRFIRISDLEDGVMVEDEVKNLKEDSFEEMNRGYINSKDLFLTLNGHSIGGVGIVPPELDGAHFTDNAAKITNLDGAIPEYLLVYLQSYYGQGEISRHTVGSGQPKLSLFRAKRVEVLLPPIEQQKRLKDTIETINQEIQVEKRLESRLKSLKCGLMQDLLSGKVRTTDTNIEVPEEIAQYG